MLQARAIVVAVATLSAPFGATAQDASALAAVSLFRQQFAAMQFETMYKAATAQLQQQTTLAQFIGVMTAYHAKMGRFVSATQTGFEVVGSGSDSYVEITFVATYANGTADEKLVFKTGGGAPTLEGFSTTNIKITAP